MPQRSNDPSAGTSLGIEFVYDAGLQKIREQMSLIDSLDVKMGVLIGFLGVLIAGTLAAFVTATPSTLSRVHTWWSKVLLGLAGLSVAASLYSAFQAFRMRRYQSGARFEDLYVWANEDVNNTKKEFLPTILASVRTNDEQLRLKQHHARWAVCLVFTALLALLLVECIIAIRCP